MVADIMMLSSMAMQSCTAGRTLLNSNPEPHHISPFRQAPGPLPLLSPPARIPVHLSNSQVSAELKLPYREGLVKNRYVGRTFIMPDQRMREMSVRRKLNAMPAVFEGKNVLLIDDSIVRGTTMAQIVDMVRRAGAKKVRLVDSWL
jgi:hypothetical protein